MHESAKTIRATGKRKIGKDVEGNQTQRHKGTRAQGGNQSGQETTITGPDRDFFVLPWCVFTLFRRSLIFFLLGDLVVYLLPGPGRSARATDRRMKGIPCRLVR